MQILKKVRSLVLLIGIGLIIFPLSAENMELNQSSGPVDVRGTVTDNFGDPLIGVNVRGGSAGTITDINGEYSLRVASDTTTLFFSYIGFKTEKVSIGTRRVIAVVLSEDSEALEEVQVVAFGKQKKQNITGSITTIKPTELKVPSSNLTTALAGRVAGVISYQRSGEPGQDNADFFVRGVTTFGYKVDPLILIDNMEVSSEELARLSTDDIESFSIMKDATSTALYGARGANGVILVTTKQGVEGKAKVNVRLENSVSAATQNVELADPITYMRLHNEAVLTRDPLGAIKYSDQKIDNTIAGVNQYFYPATDWQSELLNNYTMNQRVNMSISGGGKVARYYVSGTFSNDNGILKVPSESNFNNNISLKKYSLRSNVDMDLTTTTTMVVRLGASFDNYSGPIDGGKQVYWNIMRTNPVMFPAYYPKDEAHQHTQHILFGNYDGRYLNPYADMVKGYKDYSTSNMSAQLELRQNLKFITDGLYLRGLMNTTRYSNFDVKRSYTPFYYYASTYNKDKDTYVLTPLNEDSGTEYLDYNPGARTINSDLYVEGSINYDKVFKEDHGVSGLLVFMLRDKLSSNADGNLQKSLPHRNLGVSGRFTYSYSNRYSAELNFGYNGSERFHKKQRFGFFPSAGAAWNLSNENFWGSDLRKLFPKVKFKATYGLVGNDAIGKDEDRFFYLSQVNMNNAGRGAMFGREYGQYQRNGISLSRYANDDITWEKSLKANFGMELNILGDFEVVFDIYNEHRTNIFMTRTATPATMGLSAQPSANLGEANGRGIDLSIDYNKVISNDLWIQGRANFTYATSEYLVYEEPTYDDAPWKSHVGYSLKQNWGYIAERLFVDDEEALNSPKQNFGEYGGGDIKYKDVNGDGQITALDQVPIGYPETPEIVYGFGASVGYKGFDFSFFFQGSARSSFWIDYNAVAPYTEYRYQSEKDNGINVNKTLENSLLKVIAEDHWSEENQNVYAFWPRLSTTSIGNNNNSQKSTWFMQNGAFLRLKSVELGYTFDILGSRTRLYISGTNLLSFSNFKLWDAEMGGNGLGYPVQRVFNIGLNLSF